MAFTKKGTPSPGRKTKVDVSTEWLKILSLGEVGTGKSVFAASFPGPMYVFPFDGKMSAYKGRDDITFVDITPDAKGWVTATNELSAVEAECKEGKWATVVLDSATAAQNCALARALQLDPNVDPVTKGAIWNVHHPIKTNLAEGFFRRFLSLPNCHTVLIAHFAKITDKKGAFIAYEPGFAGRLVRDIPCLYDESYLHLSKMVQGKQKCVIVTAPKGDYKSVRSSLRGMDASKPIEIDNNYEAIIKNYINK